MVSIMRRTWNGTPIEEDISKAGRAIFARDIGNQNGKFRIHSW
jgi:hypothetical protein